LETPTLGVVFTGFIMPEHQTTSAVTAQLPPFWKSKPNTWFAQVEAQFHLRSVTDDATKYAYLVTALDDSISTRVSDLLENPPARDRYKTLKYRLLQTFQQNDAVRAAQILDCGPLGAEMPSERMDMLLSLIPPGREPCFLFKEIFLRQLPVNIRQNLLSREFLDLRTMARAADLLIQVDSGSVETVQKKSPKKPLGRQRQTGQDATTSPCWYHTNFGAAAAKCRPPCSFVQQTENSTAGRQ
jgi:hypothetical protein